MSDNANSTRKVVAVFLETVRSEDRDCLRGIAGFADGRPDWDFYIEERPVREIDQLPLKKIDGVIVRLNNPALLQAILSARIPAVNLSGREATSPMPRVCNNNEAIGIVGAEYFLARGYQHLAVFGSFDHHGIAARMEGFHRTLQERGAHCQHFPENYEAVTTYAEWARDSAMPVATLVCRTGFARDLMHSCRKVGISIPEKVAVLGVSDDDLVCGFTSPRLSSIRCNGYRVGHAAAALLAKQMAGQPVDQETRIAPMGVVTRRSSDMLAVSDIKLVAALKFIRENYDHPITCDEVADAAELHRRTLDRRFGQILDRSVAEEIRRVRIESGKRLLVNTEDTLAQIAERCGFDYPERFSVVFKRIAGVTPSAYRQRFRG